MDDDEINRYYASASRGPMTIRQKIKAAKKVFVYLDPDYLQNDSPHGTVTIPVSAVQALKIVDMAPKDNPPTGIIDADGHLLLQPPTGRKAV